MYELKIITCFISENTEDLAEEILISKTTNFYNLDFLKSAKCFADTKKIISITDVINNCSFKRKKEWDDYYKMSSNIIHASMQTTSERICKFKDISELIVGPSNYGLHYAGHTATISMNYANTILLTLIPVSNALIDLETLEMFTERTVKFSLEINDGFNGDNTTDVDY